MDRRSGAGALIRLMAGLLLACAMAIGSAAAAPYAAVVMDARDGRVLHARNHDTRLHPASLTKMMTLYVVFEAVENGEIALDDQVTISRFAASEPPSRLGLRAGQKIALRHLIRAAAVKSANDAATALGEAVSGSETAFAARMNRTAAALGMSRTTFQNAHGLTQQGHLSTARDMTTLGRHLFYDYPDYYNLFSRRSTDANGTTVSNTNRRLLAAYKGADGIKTGFTNAAGFNLVASAERGGERIIATVFGGTSGAARNRRVAELLDMGFSRAPTQVTMRLPARPTYGAGGTAFAAAGVAGGTDDEVRMTGLVTRSARPLPAPRGAPLARITTSSSGGLRDAIEDGVTEAIVGPIVPGPGAALEPAAGALSLRFAGVLPEGAAAPPPLAAALAPGPDLPEAILVPASMPAMPAMRPAAPRGVSVPPTPVRAAMVLRRADTAGPGDWGLRLMRRGTAYEARQDLVRAALAEPGALGPATRAVQPVPGGHAAAASGLAEATARRACARLGARGMACELVAP